MSNYIFLEEKVCLETYIGYLFIFFGMMCVMLRSMVSIGNIKEDNTPTISGSGSPSVIGVALQVATKLMNIS